MAHKITCALFLLVCTTQQPSIAQDGAAETAAAQIGSLLTVPSSVYLPEVVRAPLPAETIDHLHEQLRAAVDEQRISDAFQLACHILQAEPDDEVARRVLGFQRVGDNWGGQYAANRAKYGYEWDAEFGWVKPEWLPRMRAGERPAGRRWISAEVDARRHATIREGWSMRTDHVLVVTNHSLEAAVQMAVRLETLYQLWRQLFGEFTIQPQRLKARLEGKDDAGARTRPFKVVFHRSRDQYNSELRARQPQIDITLGIYFDRFKESHFFAGEDQDPGTINHEAVHQFFHESTGARRNVALTANTWAVEGVACYFESLAKHRVPLGPDVSGELELFAIGLPGAGRLEAARQRRLIDDYYIPLAELCALGTDDLQGRADIAPLYSQSAGLAAFFMDYEGGRYRPAFTRMLRSIYAGKDGPDTILDVTERSFGELDAQYRVFLESLPAPGTN